MASSIFIQDAFVHFQIYATEVISLKKTLAISVTSKRERKKAGIRVMQPLYDISFELKDGNKLGLAAQTTLLHLLTGVYTPLVEHFERHGIFANLIDLPLSIKPNATDTENITLCAPVIDLRKKEIDCLTLRHLHVQCVGRVLGYVGAHLRRRCDNAAGLLDLHQRAVRYFVDGRMAFSGRRRFYQVCQIAYVRNGLVLRYSNTCFASGGTQDQEMQSSHMS
jgi:hypothetical protein